MTDPQFSSIMTYTGRAFDPLNPRVEDVDIHDIIQALPHVNRYNGHTRYPYSVAAHSCVLFDYGFFTLKAPRTELAQALLHDAAEVYFGDFPTPVKRALPMLRDIDRAIRHKVFEAFDLPHEEPEWLVDADRRICLNERDVLFSQPIPWPWGDLEQLEPLDVPKIPHWWDVERCRQEFRDRLAWVGI